MQPCNEQTWVEESGVLVRSRGFGGFVQVLGEVNISLCILLSFEVVIVWVQL